MRKHLLIVTIVLLIAILAMGCSTDTTTEGTADAVETTKVIKFQLGHVNPGTEADYYNRLGQNFADNLNELSDGRYEVTVIGEGQLGGERDMIEGMKMETLDMAIITSMSFGTFVPETQIFDLPYSFTSSEQAAEVLDGELGDTISDLIYEKANIKVLAWGEGGFRNVLNNIQPINTIEDLEGLKIRVPGSKVYVNTFEALGANPTPVAWAEAFTAIQQKTVDGLEIPVFSTYSDHYYEINDYMSLTGHFYSPLTISISQSVWDGLSEEDQVIFSKAAKQAGDDQREYVIGMISELIAEMEEAGLTVNDIEDKSVFKEATLSVYDEMRAEIGDELIDALLEATK